MEQTINELDSLLTSPANLVAPTPTTPEQRKASRGRPRKPSRETLETAAPPKISESTDKLFNNPLLNKPATPRRDEQPEEEPEGNDEDTTEDAPGKKEKKKRKKNSTPVRADELKTKYIANILKFQSEDKMHIIDHWDEEELKTQPDDDVLDLFEEWKELLGKKTIVMAAKDMIIGTGLPFLEDINRQCMNKRNEGMDLGMIGNYVAEQNIFYPYSLAKTAQSNKSFNDALEVILYKYLPATQIPPELLLGISFIGMYREVNKNNHEEMAREEKVVRSESAVVEIQKM